MALNVNRANADPFYRYKMPRLMAKIEGRGNGIKTVIANMSDIAKALERPAMYPTKYFGCELGTQTTYDAKNERYIVNGAHDAEKLQDILDGFIKKFVLCPSCDNPETTITVKRKVINSKCRACGHTFVIDSRHKLATYIINNPPKIEAATEVNGNHASAERAVEDGSPILDKGPAEEELDDDDDWIPAPATDAELAEKLAGNIGKLVMDKDTEKSLDERLEMLQKFIIKAKEMNEVGDGKAIVDEAERLDIKQKAPVVAVLTLLDENILKDNQLKTHRRLFLRFTLNDAKAQKYFLGGIEQLIEKNENVLLQYSAHIVKAIYDNDLVEEEVILKWGEKPSSKFVKKAFAKKIIEGADKVLKWLKEAEEASEEEDSLSDEEVQFDERHGKTSQFVEKAKPVEVEDVKVQNDDGEEIDIDDI